MQKGFPKPLPKNLKTMIVGEGFPLPLQRIAREAERLPYIRRTQVALRWCNSAVLHEICITSNHWYILKIPLTKGITIMKYVCPCGYEYDPAVGDPDNGIAPGTPFEDLPEDWTCPVCGLDKDAFEKEEE